MSRNHARLHQGRWAKVRKAVFKRDGHRCTRCGKAGKLECHHRTPMAKNPGQDPYDVNGLATFCRSCHILVTRSENAWMPTARRDWIRAMHQI